VSTSSRPPAADENGLTAFQDTVRFPFPSYSPPGKRKRETTSSMLITHCGRSLASPKAMSSHTHSLIYFDLFAIILLERSQLL
jgi:hypothetical protein